MEYKKILKEIEPREYQINISKKCLEKNTLVVLPTGLGKTLIALIVAIEKIQKEPLKKILFLAPTKPLAEQHLNSFKEKLPNEWVEMDLFTGSVKKEKREKIWKEKSIIFSTPQCIANDLKNNLYSLKEVSLLIEDEAHRCVKNYDYSYIAKRYIKENSQGRTIGLTASPGNDKSNIKEILKNLEIDEIELRTRESPDVKPYLQELAFEKIEVELPKEFKEISNNLNKLKENLIDELRKNSGVFGNINKITLINLQKRISSELARGYKSKESYFALSQIAQIIKIEHAIELLETQTQKSFHKYMKELYLQAEKQKSRGVQKLVSKQEFNIAFSISHSLFKKGEEHPKIREIIKLVKKEKEKNENVKILIFTQYRETAKLVAEMVNNLFGIKSKVFVGQLKKEGIGLSQKEQKEIINEFRKNETNVLCATCIAEEGLDIPEVSTVIFYEPVSSGIRTIQRKGRTARMSQGKLIMMITKDTKDERAYYSSMQKEKSMKTQIEKVKEEIKKEKIFKENQKKLFT